MALHMAHDDWSLKVQTEGSNKKYVARGFAYHNPTDVRVTDSF